MINIEFSLTNPFRGDSDENILTKRFMITKHREFIMCLWRKTSDIISFTFQVTSNRLSPGIRLDLGLFGISFVAGFYDTRGNEEDD